MEPAEVAVEPAAGSLLARALRSTRRAYVWVYHRSVPKQLKGLSEVTGAKLSLPGMEAGEYGIEFWDTRGGRALSQIKAVVEVGARQEGVVTLEIPLPNVKGDLAIKVKRKE